ncbi:WD40-repeat-containing domain protein [Russula earlei]|uniref:WD40-repeat-containing domain protein n=1 Tax=Russula earlei TaxID=71964 RepID=A0ACC0UBD4_9AGAM|nr:WD40-repeat-containing domain protein [Russula earlei]
MDYQPVILGKHAKPAPEKHGAESRYWRSFRSPVFVKEYAPVTSVHFTLAKPHRYAVTAATRVHIYAPRTQKIVKTIARFKDVARSGFIRDDGKLLVAGDDSGLIQIFDVNSRAILRTLDAHKQPVHVTRFSALDHTQVLSCSDDTTVRLWDVPSQSTITTFVSHTDYVRSGQVSSTDPHLILTGSYDGTVRIFDTRTGECELLMGSTSARSSAGSVPVEQVLMYPSGTVALSAAGSILRVWDIVAGGRCLRAISNHKKAVTSLAFNANSSRLLSGGLDHMIKVYDVSNYNVVHTMRYSAPVICLSVSPDETHIAVGMSDGTLSVRRRQPKASSEGTLALDEAPLRVAALESVLGGVLPSIGQPRVRDRTKKKPVGDVDEFKVESKRRRRLKEYDRLLKGFKYSAALDSALRKQVPPTTTFALIQELIYRDGLPSALAGRDDVLLEPMLRLLLKYVTDPRFGAIACDVAGLIIEMYTPVLGQSPTIDSLFLRLQRKLEAELRLQNDLVKVKGALDMLFAFVALSA